jgi:excisionase family DNA binding protein
MTNPRPKNPDPASDSFGRMVVAALAGDPLLLAKLRDLLGVPAGPQPAALPAYTVASLASALGVTERVVRNAIARGELPAARRGARYLIGADAIERWAQASAPTVRPSRQFRRRAGLSEAFDRLPDRA